MHGPLLMQRSARSNGRFTRPGPCQGLEFRKNAGMLRGQKAGHRRMVDKRANVGAGPGQLADLNPKYIGEVERAEKTISLDALARLAKAMKTRVRDLVMDF